MTATSSTTAAGTGVLGVIRRHPIVAFFVISYVVTWLLWSPVVVLGLSPFSEETFAPNLYLLPAIAIGVTGTAFVLTAITQGGDGVRRLVQRLTTWRVSVLWWLVAVAMIPLAEFAAAAVLGTPDIFGALTPTALLVYPASYAAHFIFGPLFEETGWRGFALPRMQERFGPLRATLLLGLLWSAWHFFLYVPVWFAGGAADGLLGIAIFTVTTTAMTILFTWLSNNTRASLLLCILMHGSVDGTATYIQRLAARGVISPEAAGNAGLIGLLVGCVVLAVVIAAATRGRLSYGRYRSSGAEAADLEGHPLAAPSTH